MDSTIARRVEQWRDRGRDRRRHRGPHPHRGKPSTARRRARGSADSPSRSAARCSPPASCCSSLRTGRRCRPGAASCCSRSRSQRCTSPAGSCSAERRRSRPRSTRRALRRSVAASSWRARRSTWRNSGPPASCCGPSARRGHCGGCAMRRTCSTSRRWCRRGWWPSGTCASASVRPRRSPWPRPGFSCWPPRTCRRSDVEARAHWRHVLARLGAVALLGRCGAAVRVVRARLAARARRRRDSGCCAGVGWGLAALVPLAVGFALRGRGAWPF